VDKSVNPDGIVKENSYMDEKMKLDGLAGSGEVAEELSEELSVEQSFEKLDSMVKMLESEDVTLEDSFRIYQDGMKLLKHVNDKLDLYEKKMLVLSEDGVVEEFE
jgi:exodeoxyribonuclease VII small subunit